MSCVSLDACLAVVQELVLLWQCVLSCIAPLSVQQVSRPV